jgi:tripartite-type tricarboxylate transporter receptor subunit TctC
VRRLNGEVNKMLQLQDVKDRLATLGVEATGGSPEDFARVIREDTTRWAKVVNDAGIKVE